METWYVSTFLSYVFRLGWTRVDLECEIPDDDEALSSVAIPNQIGYHANYALASSLYCASILRNLVPCISCRLGYARSALEGEMSSRCEAECWLFYSCSSKIFGIVFIEMKSTSVDCCPVVFPNWGNEYLN